MNSNFTINRIFEEKLQANFTINDGSFTTNGQFFVLQHTSAIQLLTTLSNWDHVVLNTDFANYFTIEYRYSYDFITWTNYKTLLPNFSNFNNPNTEDNIWFEIKYTAVIVTPNKILQLKEFNFYGIRTIPEFFQPIEITDQPQIYTNEDTYKIFKLEDFKIYLRSGDLNNLQINFRYTQTQGRSWSSWSPLTKDNLQKSKFDRLKFVNFQFSFQSNTNAKIEIHDLELIGEFQNITANYKTMAKFGLKTQCNPLAVLPSPTGPCTTNSNNSATSCCEACASSEVITPWNSNLSADCEDCSTTNYVNLNDTKLWANQINTYNELNKFVNGTNSWKITYLLTDSDGKGIDHILHEQTIHHYIKSADLQIIVPNNQFPVENVTFSNLDMDLIQSFEIHILKDEFKKIFGVEFRPSKKDVIYFCDLNQLWEVEQMFPYRGFMLAEVYWRIILKKYNDRKGRTAANTIDGQNAQNLIDNLTKYTTLDSLFQIDVNNDLKKGTKDLKINLDHQSQQYTTKTEMQLRKLMNKSEIVTTQPIQNGSLTVSNTAYKISLKSKGIRTVEYIPTDNQVNKADNRAISFWFKTEEYNPTWNFEILNNYNTINQVGYSINIVGGILQFKFNTSIISMPLPGFLSNIWYCCLINVNQIQQQIEIAIYQRQSEDGYNLSSSQLVLFNKQINTFTPSEFTHTQTLYLGGCDTLTNIGNRNSYYITNIRIYNAIMDKTQRQTILNENVISSSQLTLLVDNAEDIIATSKYNNL